MDYYYSDSKQRWINWLAANGVRVAENAAWWLLYRLGARVVDKDPSQKPPKTPFGTGVDGPTPFRNRTTGSNTTYYENLPYSTARDQKFFGYGSRTITEVVKRKKTDNNNMEGGSRLKRGRPVRVGRKKFSRMKLMSSGIEWLEQRMGLLAPQVYQARVPNGETKAPMLFANNFATKNLVSEYNPGSGGMIPIFKSSSTNDTPMHVYDLNLYVPGYPDVYQVSSGAPLQDVTTFTDVYPVTATSQNDDINSRMWRWVNTNKFAPYATRSSPSINALVGTTTGPWPAYYINNPLTTNQDNLLNGTKVYRKGICIDFMLYGCRKTMTKYDVRVIKVLDQKYCPDLDYSLPPDSAGPPTVTQLKDFQQAWQSLVRPYCINPMLKGIEPGPDIPRRWFKTVAKKTVTIQEQSGDREQVTSYQGRIYVNLNEVNNMAWSQKGFSVESGDAPYDSVPTENVDMHENEAIHTKPHPRARYYLVVRALCPQDLATANSLDTTYNETAARTFSTEGTSTVDYTPTYDLSIRMTYAQLTGVN